jgi:hypothetical protein
LKDLEKVGEHKKEKLMLKCPLSNLEQSRAWYSSEKHFEE